MDLSKPLAYRMSPKTLDDYVGQEHILGKDKILYRTIKADRLSSIILWGPPGCGKTSLARVISNTTKYKFIKISLNFLDKSILLKIFIPFLCLKIYCKFFQVNIYQIRYRRYYERI